MGMYFSELKTALNGINGLGSGIISALAPAIQASSSLMESVPVEPITKALSSVSSPGLSVAECNTHGNAQSTPSKGKTTPGNGIA